MGMMWYETLERLEHLRKAISPYHDIKNMTDEQKEELRLLRLECVRVGEIRYRLVREGKCQ